MLIPGFGFSGYRSIGNDIVKIHPLNKINLIIGKNNSGKSNIINYLANRYSYFTERVKNRNYRVTDKENRFLSTDEHISSEKTYNRIAFPLSQDELSKHLENVLPDSPVKSAHHRRMAEQILNSDYFKDSSDTIWFTYKAEHSKSTFEKEYDVESLKPLLLEREWQSLRHRLTSSPMGDIDDWIHGTMNKLFYCPTETPRVEIVPAIRKVGDSGSFAKDFSGDGIIDRLSRIQNPSRDKQNLKNKFEDINRFVQNVLTNPDARIEIPYERDMILVHMDGKILPLESLGTGVHEVIILAAASTLLDDSILCVEEPELHLHPLLQRKLIAYLSENTNNQYFFTTHSAHLLDTAESEIFHVQYQNGKTTLKSITSTKDRSNICFDLGYKASDILQANCILWVEGPSDRVYLNYWIKKYNSELIEGVHYSIMFYGGRLFSHLSAQDTDDMSSNIEDFISLRKLNRNSVILFDSDKGHPRARINSTKTRLKNEFDSGQGFAWITKGREVENYLNSDKLEISVKTVHPSAGKLESKGQWSNLLKYKKVQSSKVQVANKVKVARHYTANNPADLSILDLKQRIKQLCEFISSVNED